MTDDQVRLALGFVYAVTAANCWLVARRLHRGDPIRALLIWLGLSAASWAAAFLVAVTRPELLSRWVSLFLLGVTWPAFVVGFVRFAARWHVAAKEASGE